MQNLWLDVRDEMVGTALQAGGPNSGKALIRATARPKSAMTTSRLKSWYVAQLPLLVVAYS
jgi:hypothetical protein